MIRVVLVREYALRGCFYNRDSIDLGSCLEYSEIKLVKLVPDLALSVLF